MADNMKYDEEELAYRIAYEMNDVEHYDNKKQLLEFLGIKPEKGNSGKKISKILDKYLEIETTEGSRAITVKKRAQILPYNDGRKNRQLICEHEFEIILSELKSGYYTKQQLYTAFNCLGADYKERVSKFDPSPYKYAWNGFQNIVSKICSFYVIERLEKFGKKGTAAFTKCFKAGNEYYDQSTMIYDDILEIENDVAKKLGFDSSHNALFSNKRKEYEKRCKALVSEQLELPNYFRLYYLNPLDIKVEHTDEELKNAKQKYRQLIYEKVLQALSTAEKNAKENINRKIKENEADIIGLFEIDEETGEIIIEPDLWDEYSEEYSENENTESEHEYELFMDKNTEREYKFYELKKDGYKNAKEDWARWFILGEPIPVSEKDEAELDDGIIGIIENSADDDKDTDETKKEPDTPDKIVAAEVIEKIKKYGIEKVYDVVLQSDDEPLTMILFKGENGICAVTSAVYELLGEYKAEIESKR